MKPVCSDGEIDRQIGGIEHHPHEEMTGLDIVELLGVENVLPVMGKERRHRGHDAGTIRAGQRQDELMIGHGADLVACLRGLECGFAALLYHPRWPCANPAGGIMMNKSTVDRRYRATNHG